MQFSQKIAISVAFVSTLALAAPVQPKDGVVSYQPKDELVNYNAGMLLPNTFAGFKGGDLHLRDDSVEKREPGGASGIAAGLNFLIAAWNGWKANHEADVSARDFNSDLSLEKRLSWGKFAAGAAAAVVGWFTTKEGQEFLATSEGQAFVSKLAANDSSLSKREPLNAAVTIGLTVGAVFKGLFGHKEAEEFFASDEGKAAISKLMENDSLSKREPLGAAIMWGSTIGEVLKGLFGSKEAEEFMASDEGKAAISKMMENDSLSKRDSGLEARGKADYLSLSAAIINFFNAIRSHKRDLAEGSSVSARDVDEGEIEALLSYMSKQAEINARSADNFDLLG